MDSIVEEFHCVPQRKKLRDPRPEDRGSRDELIKGWSRCRSVAHNHQRAHHIMFLVFEDMAVIDKLVVDLASDRE